MKKINISEDKLKKALREIFKEEMYQSNQEPFAGQNKFKREGTPEDEVEDGYGYGIVGNNAKGDPTLYPPNQELNRYGVKGNGMA